MKFKFLTFIILIFSSLWAQAKKYELIIPLVTNESSYNYKAAQAFKHHVETFSSNEISVQLYSSGSLCASARECFDMLGMGNADIFQSNLGEPANWMPEFAVLDLPYMLRDDAVAECVFDDEAFLSELRSEFLNATGNFRLMMISNSGGWRNFSTTRKPIHQLEDLKNLKIRTIPADLQKELTKQLGAVPTGIAWGEVYTSLGSSLVEGTKNGITDITTMNFQDHLKYITLDQHSYMGGTWFINNDRFMELPDELKKIVIEGFDVMNQYLRSYPKYHEIEAYEKFEKAGGEVILLSEEEKAKFKDQAQYTKEWLLKQNPTAQKWLDLYEQTIHQCEGQIDARLKSLME